MFSCSRVHVGWGRVCQFTRHYLHHPRPAPWSTGPFPKSTGPAPKSTEPFPKSIARPTARPTAWPHRYHRDECDVYNECDDCNKCNNCDRDIRDKCDV